MIKHVKGLREFERDQEPSLSEGEISVPLGLALVYTTK